MPARRVGVHQNRKLAVEWVQKASFNGNAQARCFAQHLLSRGNFIGFRNEQEEAYVIAGKLRTGLLWEEPVGVLFRSSGERLAYIKNLRHRVDRYEAYLAVGAPEERVRRLHALGPLVLLGPRTHAAVESPRTSPADRAGGEAGGGARLVVEIARRGRGGRRNRPGLPGLLRVCRFPDDLDAEMTNGLIVTASHPWARPSERPASTKPAAN